MKEGVPQEETPIKSQESFVLPPLLPEEQPEEYLSRVCMLSEYPDHTKETDWDTVASAIQKLECEFVDTKLSEEKRALVREQVLDAFLATSGNVYHDELGPNYFQTNRTRMFADRYGGIYGKAYTLTMFAIPYEDKHGNPVIHEYLKEKIHGKDIMLLGGGDSAMDLIVPSDHLDIGLRPHKVINVDKYVRGEVMEKGYALNTEDEIVYTSVPALAQDTEDVSAAIKESGLEGVDEIWAQYSVPYYLETIDDVTHMFETVKRNLALGGTARFYPIGMNIPLKDLIRVKDIREQFVQLVDSFNESSDFKAYVVFQYNEDQQSKHAATLIIKRLKSTE
jgi:hypothetical protein